MGGVEKKGCGQMKAREMVKEEVDIREFNESEM